MVSCDLFYPPSPFSPPDWIIGTWSDSFDINAYTFSSDNIVFITSGITIDYKELCRQSARSGDIYSDLEPNDHTYIFQMSSGGVTLQYIFEKTSTTTLNYSIGASTIELIKDGASGGYTLRGTGPAGGYIFYDKGYYSDGWRYLEAAPNDQSLEISWGGEGTAIPGADGTVVGTGKQNTTEIVAQLGSSDSYAAGICDSLILGGYSDWFLPSRDELLEMYNNLKLYGIGNFPDGYIWWSSSEYNSTMSWFVRFEDGASAYVGKAGYSVCHVRAARSF